MDEPGGSTSHLVKVLARTLDRFVEPTARSILEVGCGTGTRLAAAAARGWRCFGVEVPDEVRAEAQHRLGEDAYIVKSISDLFARKFDVVLMLDVIERYPLPDLPLYELFSLGAIAPDTVLVVTAPERMVAMPNDGAEALTQLLRRLRFTEVEVTRLSPAKLIATASGSDFQNFMHERYVPGTWSRIAAYEHIPRYDLAKTLAAGKAVLDFGCGTGYGAAILANVATHVTGLDIDESALAWACQTHRIPNLAFQRHDDLGATLPAASFDLVTCFEMIEHVNFSTQQRSVANMARLLRDDGLLIISTPNPEVTKLYGANPYHLREMTEAEFRDLLSPSFPYIQVLRQHVKAGVTFSQGAIHGAIAASPLSGDADQGQLPVAFIALCGRHPLPALPDSVFFDDASNYVGDFLSQERNVQVARSEAYNHGIRARSAAQKDAQVPLQQAIQAKDEIQRQLDLKTVELEALRRTRKEELVSPRFLAKRLLGATRARLWSIVSGRRKDGRN